jgi:enoyl-CoA hydratase
MSAYEESGRSLEDAMKNELAHGMRSLSSPELFESLGRFAAGAGRHGEGT